ncbi:MAG: hypothetical protein LBE09_09070 [Christensenellaceae bacterium]|jgi:hypothetical protein|nr:hypothetical protein [Christensenellaceae bacterium]
MTIAEITILFGEAISMECDDVVSIKYNDVENPSAFTASINDGTNIDVVIKQRTSQEE